MSGVKFDQRWFEGLHGADLLAEKLNQVINAEGNSDAAGHIEATLLLVAGILERAQYLPLKADRAKVIRKILSDLLKQAMQRPIIEPSRH
jgi:hypothetical protein